MNVAEYILVFAGIPLAIILGLAALTLLPGGRRPRYRPGQPWTHEPVWYEPHPEGGTGGHIGGPGAPHGEGTAIASSAYPERPGITAGSPGPREVADTPQPVPGGPLGGARGTW